MSNTDDVYKRSRAGFNAAMTETRADYQRAEAAGDVNGQVAAAQQLAGLQASVVQLDQLYQNETRAVQPQGSKRNELTEKQIEAIRDQLTDEQRVIARTSFSPDSRGRRDSGMSEDDMERSYVRNMHKLAVMRATGNYPMPERN